MEWAIHLIIEALHEPNFWDRVYAFSRDHPVLAWMASFTAVVVIGSVLIASVLTFFRELRRYFRARPVTLALTASAVLAGLLVYGANSQLAPVPVIDPGQRLFVREPAVVRWNYDPLQATTEPTVYEVELARDAAFTRNKTVQRLDGKSWYSYQKGGPTYWRVRAITEAGKASSGWSRPVETKYYPDTYSRITDTSNLVVYISNSLNQSIFKFVNSQGQLAGADIEIAKAIATQLTDSLASKKRVQPIFWPVRWGELLDSQRAVGTDKIIPNLIVPDMMISQITKRDSREKNHEIKFSNAYYCTTLSLVYGDDQPEKPIFEMLEGKTVGYQEKSTSQNLVEQLANKISFKTKSYDQADSMLQALRNGRDIHLAVTDSPYAIAELLIKRSPIRYRPFRKDDFAVLMKKEFLQNIPKEKQQPVEIAREQRIEEYAIAVHNSE